MVSVLQRKDNFCYTSLPCILGYSLKRQNHFTVPTCNAWVCLFPDKAKFLSFLLIVIKLKVICNENIILMCFLMIAKVYSVHLGWVRLFAVSLEFHVHYIWKPLSNELYSRGASYTIFDSKTISTKSTFINRKKQASKQKSKGVCGEVFTARAFQVLGDRRANCSWSKKDTPLANGKWPSPNGPSLPVSKHQVWHSIILPRSDWKGRQLGLSTYSLPQIFSDRWGCSSRFLTLLSGCLTATQKALSLGVKPADKACFKLSPPYYAPWFHLPWILPFFWRTLAKTTTAKSFFSNVYHSR